MWWSYFSLRKQYAWDYYWQWSNHQGRQDSSGIGDASFIWSRVNSHRAGQLGEKFRLCSNKTSPISRRME